MRIHRIGQTKSVMIKRFIVKVQFQSRTWKGKQYLTATFFALGSFVVTSCIGYIEEYQTRYTAMLVVLTQYVIKID